MNNPMQTIKENRKKILTGEIGALLHDIGKCHPDFVKSKSIEKTASDEHAQIDKFLKNDLISFIKDEKFKIKIMKNETDVYSLITKHHSRGKSNKLPELVKFIISCDKLDSADDKGIVRRKQSIEHTIISSPFGYPKEKIDLQCLEKRFTDLQNNLLGLFNNYIAEKLSLTCMRESLINNLNTIFSHALGETRIPANDVTLWDHSHSTASLFKSVLCEHVLGINPDHQELHWRLFGLCWDGIGFINKGRKVADILKRNEIIEEIKKELKKKFEDEIPIGNVIYEDINGVYFTFPTLNNDKAKELAKECAQEGLKIIRENSNNEIWPFFTLSKASRTLTILAAELKFASKKRNMPKMTPTLFIEEKEKIIFDNPEMLPSKEGEEICPVCRLRAKPVENEICNVCKDRRGGRLGNWLNNRENTIWINEVADKNNRNALLTLSFNLDKWLDGTMVRTIYSQIFEDWLYGKKKKNGQEKSNIQLFKEAGISEHSKPDKEVVFFFTDEVIKNLKVDKKKAAEILDTFFPDININEGNLDQHIKNIKERIQIGNLTRENLATYLFTHNPSPARLYRIWRESEEFFELVIREIKSDLFCHKWKRVTFSVNYESLKSELERNNINPNNLENFPLVIKIKGLELESLLVLHTSNGQFWTIESLEKFRFKEKFGVDAIENALKSGFYWLAKEDEPDTNLLSSKNSIKAETIKQENYYPFIVVTKSPLSLRLIGPAEDIVKILDLVVKLYNQRFEKVIGKLPLNAGLLVVKRKFPLYVLLDACERLFHAREFAEPERMNPWWDVERINKYFTFYLTKTTKEKFILNDLAQLSKGKQYSLFPGYFDFDLLLGTDDRYKITYEGKRRVDEEYKLYSKRPFYFYQISEMIDLWEILKNNISSSQRNFIEESLTSKLREWRNVDDAEKENIFKRFVVVTLKDAFGDRWDNLRPDTKDFILNSAFNRLLLDTLVFFRHIIKEKEYEENE